MWSSDGAVESLMLMLIKLFLVRRASWDVPGELFPACLCRTSGITSSLN